jgi:hypothetical protein
MSDKNAALELEVVDESGYVAAVVLDGAFLRAAGGGAMAAQVAGDDFVGR